MASLNKAMLIGHLGDDPVVKTMQSGDQVVNLSLATSESWTDKHSGKKRERTQWHRVVIFNQGLAKVAGHYLRKGSQVYIEGQLETRKWQDQQGQDRYVTEVVLRPYGGTLKMLGGRRDGAGGSASDGGAGGQQPAPQSHADLDDDIPF